MKSRAAYVHLNLNYPNFSYYWDIWKNLGINTIHGSKVTTRASLGNQIAADVERIQSQEEYNRLLDEDIQANETVLMHRMNSLVNCHCNYEVNKELGMRQNPCE